MFIRHSVIQGGTSSSSISPPVFDVLPLISGNAYLNMQLDVSGGTISGGGTITRTYQWRRAGVNIAGQTGSSYVMVQADTVDSLPVIDCQVTATNEAGVAVAYSANSILCKPVILMSVSKTSGNMAFAGALTRKAGSPTSVVIQWGDNSATTPTASITKTYGVAGTKNIRVYSELNNLLSFTVQTASTRLVSFAATEPISSITAISILNQTTAGLFTTLTISGLSALVSLTLTSSTLTEITSTQINNLVSFTTLNIGSMTALTNLTLPVFPVLNSINASSCTSLAIVSVNNNPSLTQLSLSRGAVTFLDISSLTELVTLTLGNALAGNVLDSLDVSANTKIVNLNAENIGLNTFVYTTLNAALVINLTNNNLTGSYAFTSPLLVQLDIDQNAITGLAVSSTALQTIDCSNNNITDFDFSGKTNCTNITVSNNNIDGDGLSDMLAELVVNGASDGQFIGTSQSPPVSLNAQGLIDKATLEGLNWFIDVDA